MSKFDKQVNTLIINPCFIPGIRKMRALDQREATKIFGDVVNTSLHYENDRPRPPLALVKALNRHSDLLNEIRVAWQIVCLGVPV